MCEGAADKTETGARCSSESCLPIGIETQLFADSGGSQAESSGICRVRAPEEGTAPAFLP